MTVSARQRGADWLDAIELVYGDPLEIMGNCVRGAIIPAPGKLFNCVDFSAIEARVLAWWAGEERVLDVFRSGADIYCFSASAIYGYLVEKATHPTERQIGKVSELAFGYQGGVGAGQTFARQAGLSLEDEFIDSIKRSWRSNRPLTVNTWKEVNNAAIRATEQPGTVTSAGAQGRKVFFRKNGSFLVCQLPSKRRLYYPYPEIRDVEAPWSRKAFLEWRAALAEGTATEADRPEKEYIRSLTYMGLDQKTNQWTRHSTYGGKLTENIVQAIARDLLVFSMRKLDAAGFTIVMHVHDEILCEEDGDRLEEMCALMTEIPGWAEGLPMKVEGWTGDRYRK